ncbi:MAG: DeoR/GlpR family DNA-binding transcription regulator [Eubacteriales bacterium]|nr:DeoR/GlpR family DNA-binding transcription regulator [Eubacteriales bacterium]
MNERQKKLLEYLIDKGEAKNKELLKLSGDYTNMTLWRDLEKLEAEGLIKRIWGGAMIIDDTPSEREHNFNFRIRQNTAAKEEISKIAADLIKPSRSYYFDAGSTIYTMTRFLPDERYTVITSAANVAVELAHRSKCSVTLLGGQLDAVTLSCSGSQSLDMLSDLNVEVAIMATSGYTSHTGFTCGSLNESQLKKSVINKSRVTIMLLDNDKVGNNLPYTFSRLGNIDALITDIVTDELVFDCERQNVKLFYPGDGLTSAKRKSMIYD